jgi:urea transport system permease protein
VIVPALFAAGFGYLGFRSRIRGVYFAIITQALALSAWLVFNRNEMNLGGTNGLTGFKKILGFQLDSAVTQRWLFIATAIVLCGAYLLCRWIVNSRAGRILLAIRDAENRVFYSGYTPSNYKMFVFTVSAALAGVAGALYAPQVGIITPGRIGVLPSIEMVIWVAVGGRGTLIGAILGAISVSWARSFLTSSFPNYWLYFQGGMFILVVHYMPDGIVGLARQMMDFARMKMEKRSHSEPASSSDLVAAKDPEVSGDPAAASD